LAAAGATLGFLLARSVVPLLSQLVSVDVSAPVLARLSPTMILFGAFATLFCSAALALPALFHTRGIELYQIIKKSSGLSLTQRRSHFGFAILAIEIALAFAVLTGAGLLYRRFCGTIG
jgi:hypothetical protein